MIRWGGTLERTSDLKPRGYGAEMEEELQDHFGAEAEKPT